MPTLTPSNQERAGGGCPIRPPCYRKSSTRIRFNNHKDHHSSSRHADCTEEEQPEVCWRCRSEACFRWQLSMDEIYERGPVVAGLGTHTEHQIPAGPAAAAGTVTNVNGLAAGAGDLNHIYGARLHLNQVKRAGRRVWGLLSTGDLLLPCRPRGGYRGTSSRRSIDEAWSTVPRYREVGG